MALRALAALSSQFSVQSSIDTAKAYLLTKQNTDGGFGSSPSKVYETALSIISLIESGQAPTQPLQNAINYLTSAQLTNGSWNDDPYSTALALQALAKVKPNLTISSSDIAFSQTTPTLGDPVTITVTVPIPAWPRRKCPCRMRWRPAAGGPPADLTIPSIASGGSASVQVVHTVTADTDRRRICKSRSPNIVEELNEADNTAINYYLFSL
jgi:hypothetical protein